MARAALAPTGAGPGIGGISLDDANKKFEQKLPVFRSQWRKDAIVSREIRRKQASPQLQSARGQVQLAHTTIRAIHTTVDEPHLFQLIDDLTRIDGNDAQGVGQAALIDTWHRIKAGNHGPLQLRQSFIGERLGDDRDANLLEPARQVGCPTKEDNRRRGAGEHGFAGPRAVGVGFESGHLAKSNYAYNYDDNTY